ncbi:MAG: hypothetical protein HPY83_07915 [Anaerolineae bacterium]|nr:hypothetical protein [Anaerolineae bacterium]
MLRRLAAVLLFVMAMTAVTASAASLAVNGGCIQAFVIDVTVQLPTATSTPACTPTATPEPTAIAADLDLKPESLEKKSQGSPVTAFIELPPEHDVAQIDVTTLLLCLQEPFAGGCVPPDGLPGGGKPKVGDADKDGIPDLKVTFDRAAVIGLVADIQPPADVVFTVSGLVDGRPFAGRDTVRLVDPEAGAAPELDTAPTATVAATPTPTPVPTATPTPTREATETAAPEGTAEPAPASPTVGITDTAVPTPQEVEPTVPAPLPDLRPSRAFVRPLEAQAEGWEVDLELTIANGGPGAAVGFGVAVYFDLAQPPAPSDAPSAYWLVPGLEAGARARLVLHGDSDAGATALLPEDGGQVLLAPGSHTIWVLVNAPWLEVEEIEEVSRGNNLLGPLTFELLPLPAGAQSPPTATVAPTATETLPAPTATEPAEVPTEEPTATATLEPTPTEPVLATDTPVTEPTSAETATATQTPVADWETPTPTPGEAPPLPTPTATTVPSPTPEPVPTVEPTATPEATATPVPTATPAPEPPSATPTSTPMPTQAASPTPTGTPTPTAVPSTDTPVPPTPTLVPPSDTPVPPTETPVPPTPTPVPPTETPAPPTPTPEPPTPTPEPPTPTPVPPTPTPEPPTPTPVPPTDTPVPLTPTPEPPTPTADPVTGDDGDQG